MKTLLEEKNQMRKLMGLSLLKEEDESSGSISMTPTTNCIDSTTTPKIKRIFNKLTNLGYKCHGVSGRSIGVKKTISCPDGIEQEIHIDITTKEGFWDPKPGDLNYTLVSDGKVVSGYEYNPIKLQKVKSLENTIKNECGGDL